MAHEWKVRSMDEADSEAAVEAAGKLKITTAVWLGRAIREKLARDREPIIGQVVETREIPLLPVELFSVIRDFTATPIAEGNGKLAADARRVLRRMLTTFEAGLEQREQRPTLLPSSDVFRQAHLPDQMASSDGAGANGAAA